MIPDKQTIILAADNIKPYIHRTPVLTSESLNKLTGCDLYFKCENFQKTGSFKIRGAMNAVLSLTKDELKKGIVTHSSGNFAQALAYASLRGAGAKAKIVMPENVIPLKHDAVLGYGAEIIYSGNMPLDRENKCSEVINETGASFIHPSNDIRVITGHSSSAIELINDTEDLDFVFCPIGGGGLISGISIGFSHFSSKTKIIGAEPLNADDAYQSIRAGKIIPQTNPNTIADGLRTSLGDVTFPLIQKYVSEIIRVSEEEIKNAMKLIWERMKIVVEPSGAVSFAALIQKSSEFKNKKTGIIVSGGNLDTSKINI
ncbi:MAG: threonine/serine dehydratase [Chlorobi bacterium]|nr:threonine/serine dehydratase [Chlorobiota bacterium]MCI0716269.1 threonine/serine dehydratase [Chlorobiota bacterium]